MKERATFSPHKREHPAHSKHKISSLFYIFVGHFSPSGSGSGSTFPMRIQPTKINADPCGSGSGYTTMLSLITKIYDEVGSRFNI